MHVGTNPFSQKGFNLTKLVSSLTFAISYPHNNIKYNHFHVFVAFYFIFTRDYADRKCYLHSFNANIFCNL